MAMQVTVMLIGVLGPSAGCMAGLLELGAAQSSTVLCRDALSRRTTLADGFLDFRNLEGESLNEFQTCLYTFVSGLVCGNIPHATEGSAFARNGGSGTSGSSSGRASNSTLH